MKKAFEIIILFLLIFIYVSCATGTTYSEITEEEAAYSMNLAMTTAFENTASRLINVSNTMNTIPDQYKILDDTRNDVPGLNAILNSWDDEVKIYIKAQIPSMKEELSSYVFGLTYENPLEFITKSDTSGSELFESLYFDKVLDFCRRIAENADYSTLEKAVYQYNLYIRSNDMIYKTNTEKLEIQDVSDYFTDILTTDFFNVLFSSEELYRTTPDPYKDRTAAVVFSVE